MNKTAIKNFAIWARNKLIADIAYKAGLLGITEKEIKDPLPQSTQTVQFFDIGTNKQSDLKTAYKSVVEEVAYTWFNRLIAIRFMEVNDYLPSRIRVLSSESSNKAEPDLVTNPMDTNFEYTPYEKDRIMQLKQDNKLDELFRMLFIKQCNALNAVLPELFEKTNHYTELLLNVSFTDQDGVVYHLVNDLSEDDFKKAVEIIGWMYQYYNNERKNEVINIYKGTVKKEDIPAATQLFTTDWVVRYMVDNSLGRYWIERNPESKLREKLKFFVAPKDDDIVYVDEKVDPTEMTFFDPCMGSGHILVYAFDVLMEIYRERGYSDIEAAICILQYNLFGLDIDNRAYQLSYFAIMMKARNYNRRALSTGIINNIGSIQESNGINKFFCDSITNDLEQNKVGEYLVSAFKNAKEIGSLLTAERYDYKSFYDYLLCLKVNGQIDILTSTWMNETLPLMQQLTRQAGIMSKKYTVVCTNPPYMNKLESHLKDFVTTEYKLYSGDIFSVFMYRNFAFCKQDGYSAFMTPFVWMFIKTYENLREYIINNKSITTLVQMEYSAFEEATVPICSFVLKNGNHRQNGIYIKLSDFKGGMDVQRQKVLEAIANEDCGYFYVANAENFAKVPSMPIAYWINQELVDAFQNGERTGYVLKCYVGMRTGDNSRFLRMWYEVSISKSKLSEATAESTESETSKWVPYLKGGEFRRWYYNYDYVVNWEKNGADIKENTLKVYPQLGDNLGWKITSEPNYFRGGITFNAISSNSIGFKRYYEGAIFSNASHALMTDNVHVLNQMLAFLNTSVVKHILALISPTINYTPSDIGKIPFLKTSVGDLLEKKTEENITISKNDWDSFEVSWDFKEHPLIRGTATIVDAFSQWKQFTEIQFNKLKANEEELNRIFIEIYGLQDELTPEVENKDVTIRKADIKRDLRSFISYAVGCMFGRYSLDVKGLAYAGGEWDESKYSTFIPDKDNILPITDEEYFEDDVVGLFCAFLKKTFGKDTLEENLDFIAKALGNKGNSSREIIRNYFLKDFFKDHCKIYQKRPIYWLFDSGKADGFKALVYMHRYNEDTIGNLRIDYLHRIQRIYENEISRMQETIENSKDAREVTTATKRKEKLLKQLKETKDYDEKIAHLALARITIDLDDGVKVNYEKVQTDTDGKKSEVLARI